MIFSMKWPAESGYLLDDFVAESSSTIIFGFGVNIELLIKGFTSVTFFLKIYKFQWNSTLIIKDSILESFVAHKNFFWKLNINC